MTDASLQIRFQDLVGLARDRLSVARAGKPSVTVQVGHCGASVGASELAAAITDRFRDDRHRRHRRMRWRLLRSSHSNRHISLRTYPSPGACFPR